MRAFENGVVTDMFGTKREEVISGLYMRSVMIYAFYQSLLDDKVKKDEVGGACEKYGREEKYI